MAKVTYLGTDMRHASNPTGTEYMFFRGVPTEVKPEDAEHYAKKQANGAPWKVDFGIVEKTKEEIKKEFKRKYGGKK